MALGANALAGDGGQSERVSHCLRRRGGVVVGVVLPAGISSGIVCIPEPNSMDQICRVPPRWVYAVQDLHGVGVLIN